MPPPRIRKQAGVTKATPKRSWSQDAGKVAALYSDMILLAQDFKPKSADNPLLEAINFSESARLTIGSLLLGQGASFTVRRVKCSDDPPRYVASKAPVLAHQEEVNDEKEEKIIRSLVNELRILSLPSLRSHENIVSLLCLCWENDSFDLELKWPILMMEYAEFGNFKSFLEQTPEVLIASKMGLCLDAGRGLQAVHDSGIIHGDVKPENILVFVKQDEEQQHIKYVAKICDFGGSIIIGDLGKPGMTENLSLLTPSSGWCDPHCHGTKRAGELISTDVYSFGMTVWAVVTNTLDLALPFILSKTDGTEETSEAIQRLEDLKLNDDLMLTYISNSLAEVCNPIERATLVSVMNCTLRVSHRERDLLRAMDILHCFVFGNSPKIEQDIVKNLGESENVGDDLARLLQRQRLSDKIKSPGIESVTLLSTDDHGPDILHHVLSRIQRSIPEQIMTTKELKEAFRLGFAYINTFQDSGHVDDGLALLLKCALGGLHEIQAIIYRLYCAFEKPFPEGLSKQLEHWLFIGTMEGSTTARADMLEFDLTKKQYYKALECLRLLYCGTGQKRFELRQLEDVGGSTGEKRILTIRSSENPNVATDRQNDYGDILLHVLSALGKTKLIGVLLDSAIINVNVTNDYRETPLLYACRAGHMQAALFLIEKGANPLQRSMFGDHCLHWLFAFDDHEISVISRVLAVTKESLSDVAREQDFGLQFEDIFIAGSPLHRAVARNNVVAVRSLLRLGADPHQLVSPGKPSTAIGNESPLAIAARLHHHVVLDILLKFSTSENKTVEPTRGQSLLYHCFSGGSLTGEKVFGTLLRHGKLWKQNAIATLDVLFRNGADKYAADVPGFPGCNVLALAAIFGGEHMVAYVLDRVGTEHIHTPVPPPVSTAHQFDIKMTPIEYALHMKKKSVVSLLVERGGRTDDFANSKNPLHDCIINNHDPSLLERFIGMGFPVDMRENDQYETPFAMAVRYRKFHHAEHLLKCGADINAEFEQGNIITLSNPSTILGLTIMEMSSSSLSALNFLCNVDRPSNQKPSLIVYRAEGETAFYRLASIPEAERDDRILMEMYKRLESFFRPTREQLDLQSKDSGITALVQAVIRGNDALVIKFLEAGASTNIITKLGYNPLGIALKGFGLADTWQLPNSPAISQDLTQCRRRRERIISALWSRDRIVLEGTESHNALLFVTSMGDCDLIRLLVGLGEECSSNEGADGETALHVAVVQQEDIDLTTEVQNLPTAVLIELGANLNATSNTGQTPAHLSAFQNNINSLRLLLQHGANLEIRDQFSLTAIDYAVGGNHLAAIELLLKYTPLDFSSTITNAGLYAANLGHIEALKLLLKKVDITQLSTSSETPLLAAAKNNQVATIQFLVKELLQDVDDITKDGLTALHHASQQGHLDTVTCLLNFGANSNAQTPTGFTALHFAATKGQSSVIHMLLDRGADLSLLTDSGANCVDAAASLGHSDIVRLLASAGADVHGRDGQGGTRPVSPWFWAVLNSRTTVLETLLELGVDPFTRSVEGGLTALHMAASEGQVGCVPTLLKCGLSSMDKDEDGNTPIHYAAELEDEEILLLFLHGGGNFASQNNDGQTALHMAAKSGKLKTVNAMIQKGGKAEIDIKDNTGSSALHLAAQMGHTPVVKVLLDAGADFELLDNNEQTATALSIQHEHGETAMKLLDYTDPNSKNSRGWSLLHWAASAKTIIILEELLKRGAKIDAQNSSGWTPIMAAASLDREENVLVLKEHGAVFEKSELDEAAVMGRAAVAQAHRLRKQDVLEDINAFDKSHV